MPISDSDFFKQATLNLFQDLEEGSLNSIYSFLGSHIPIDGITLTHYEDRKNSFRIIAQVRSDSYPKLKRLNQYPPEARAFFDGRLETLRPINLIQDTSQLSSHILQALSPLLTERSSLIRMTLRHHGKRYGSLIIQANGANRFTENHVRLIALLYEPFALALINLLRHMKIQRLTAQLEEEKSTLKREIHTATTMDVIGAESGLKEVMDMMRQVSPLDTSVLLMGETGVGKEVIASNIHRYSNRRNSPFIKVNCGAIPEGLVDSELFGHEKGAFTGAISRKKGRFEIAHGGTIFLDEIGELPLAAQVRLLRIIQTREFERVGGTETLSADVRIIAATHRDLRKMVEEGTFREDLLFRLDVFPIIIPPLRDRLADLTELVTYFIQKKTAELKISRSFTSAPGAIEEMALYSWPGNVRELENVIERELIRSSSVEGEHLIHFGKTTPGVKRKRGFSLDDTVLPLDQAISRHIRQALIKSLGRVEGKDGAAAMLDINPSTLRSKMRKMGIKFGRTKQ